jgi:Eukaryotic initiation factor 4E
MSADATNAGGAGSLSAAHSAPVVDAGASLVSPGAGEHSQTQQEVYSEPISKELQLSDNWVFWEHYDPAPGAPYKKPTHAASWSQMHKLAWFNDIVTFWQLWSKLPFTKLENYFFDRENTRVPVY